jgi:3-oxosteroid 1-dehydrogenase
VLLAAGGFERNAGLRQRYQRPPIGTDWTTGSAGNTGDAITAGETAGAALDLMDDAWWGPSIPLTGGPYFCLAERSLPGCILVNGAGQRFVNESAPYVDAVHAMYDGHGTGTPHIPSWLIFDQRYRNSYVFAGLPPRRPLPRRWYAAGAVFRAPDLGGLAELIGLEPGPLAKTVARFNEFAEAGQDGDFGRGDSAYDRYYGDPRRRPNPNLGPLAQPPFYAVKIVPGDLGTKGGLRTDERARVLRADGTVIPGLYAAGNASASVMGHSYAGAGATIGPAMTFGYIAALDLAGDAA